MSNRSFINFAAEERRERLVVGRIVARRLVACLAGRLQRVEHGVDCLVRIGRLALTLHGVEIIHIGLIGLFVVAEQAHRKNSWFERLRQNEAASTSLENAWRTYSTTFG